MWRWSLKLNRSTNKTSLIDFDRDSGLGLIESIRNVNQESRKVAALEQEFLRAGLALWTNEETSRDAEAILVEYWQLNIEGEDAIRTEAQIRAAFHKASEAIHDFTNEAGVVVEDDKLVIAKTRAKRKDAWQKVSDAVKKSKLPKAALGRVAKAALVQLQTELKAQKSK